MADTTPKSPLQAASQADASESLLQRMSGEVNPEASRALAFIVDNARVIVLFFVLCAALGVGYGIWSWYASTQAAEARDELGRIELIADAAERLAALETFAADAPESVRVAANLALANTAQGAGAYERAATAWGVVAAEEGDTGTFAAVAFIGQAEALIQAGKDADALALLQTRQSGISDTARGIIDRLIVDLAEKLQRYDVGIAACESLAANPTNSGDADFWRQKAAALKALAQPGQPS